MKKHFSPLFSFSIVFFSLLMLYSCQSDETEMGMQSKIELLKSKSAEFAKKYGVDVTLNDDSIAKYADKMTVESMEEDYKAFAEMKNMQSQDVVAQVSMKSQSLSKKNFIRRRKVETETITPDMYDKSGDFSVDGQYVNKKCCDYVIGYSASVSWKYSKGTPSCKLENLTLRCRNPKCFQAMGPQCAVCTLAFENISLITTGKSENRNIEISAHGFIGGKVCMYSFNNVMVAVYLNESTGQHSVSLTL